MEGKQAGFQLDAVRNFLPNIDNHRLLLGKEVSCVIEQIGNNIDFLILDTVHVMPGELFEFSLRTRLLLCSVTAEKYYNVDETDGVRGFFNIAAFKIDQSTRREIDNIESFAEMRITLLKELEDYENIYMYGAGYNGRRLKNILSVKDIS